MDSGLCTYPVISRVFVLHGHVTETKFASTTDVVVHVTFVNRAFPVAATAFSRTHCLTMRYCREYEYCAVFVIILHAVENLPTGLWM